MEVDDPIETPARVEELNGQLAAWSAVYDGLRGNADFDMLADFLWVHAIDGIYRQMPRDTRMAIEVTAAAGERLQQSTTQNIERVQDGSKTRFFLNVDSPVTAVGDPKNAGRVEITRMGGPSNFRFGLIKHTEDGIASRIGGILTPGDIVSFQIKPNPSSFAVGK